MRNSLITTIELLTSSFHTRNRCACPNYTAYPSQSPISPSYSACQIMLCLIVLAVAALNTGIAMPGY